MGRQTRTYTSTLRAEQARTTRHRVLGAAARCFVERGYAGTSLAQIADRAGVSPETVKAAGPKRDLLLGAFSQAFAGAESDEPISASRAGKDVAGIRDPDELLGALARFVAEANAQTSVLWTELLSAAQADEQLGTALQALLGRRMQDYHAIVDLLVERGIAPADTDREDAAAQLSFLWSPEGHQQLVLQTGWTMQRYREWLGAAAQRLLAVPR